MKTYNDTNNKDLDSILLQAKAPEPRNNLSQNVWRLIRCTEPEVTAHTGITWMTQWAAFASALLIVAGSLYMGQWVSHHRQPYQSEVQIPVLQPQTLAGIYVTTSQGR